MILWVFWLASCTLAPEANADPADQATSFYSQRAPHERPWDRGTPVPGVPGLSAEACGACHEDLVAEWRTSAHAQAWTDPQYQAEITKSGNTWLCLNCHTPLMVQQQTWAIGLHDGDVERPILMQNPGFDAALREEGITCAACHVRDGVIVGPGLGGQAPHPVRADPSFKSGALCERCHEAQVTYEGKNFLCAFGTGTEWREGPWAAEGYTCNTCHMPSVERPAATGGPTRTVARHWWEGSGIPKQHHSPRPPPEANQPGLDLTARIEAGSVVVTMTNARAGHYLPSGDPERWVQVDVRFVDAAGAQLGSWQHRIGQRWEWEPTPRKLSDNRLAPREVRVERVPIPEGTTRTELTAESHRISKENAAYHHLTNPRFVRTHTLTLP